MASRTEFTLPRIFPTFLTLLAIPLVLGGLQLVFLGGSFYYLAAGLALGASAWRIWNSDPQGSVIFGGLLLATIVWSFYESGTNLWALAPRILPFAIIGLWFLTPWFRNPLYKGSPPPLLASPIARIIPPIGFVIAVAVFIDGTG